MITIKDIDEAAQRLQPVVHNIPLSSSTTFSGMTGAEVFLKCENQQKTGSFKVRGAYNKIMKLYEAGGLKSVIASSAGNHAQGVAFAARQIGIPATICMPRSTPIAKVSATKGYGANVVLSGSCYDDAYSKAMEIVEETGATFIHPFDDEDVMAGQGTIGMEILRDQPAVDMILVPAGGGGLLSGVAACVKQINPRIEVIGVQAEGAPAIVNSFHQDSILASDAVHTIADGIAVKVPGTKTVELINKYADDVVTVSEGEISSAILLLLERTKQVVEPAGATPLAAVLNGKVDVKGKKVACVLSGGNIDVSFIQRIIDLGLASRERKLKFCTTLLDIPGSLEHLSKVLSEAGANIIMVQYDRFSAELDPNEAIIHMACEVGGKEHGQKVVKLLQKNGYNVIKE